MPETLIRSPQTYMATALRRMNNSGAAHRGCQGINSISVGGCSFARETSGAATGGFSPRITPPAIPEIIFKLKLLCTIACEMMRLDWVGWAAVGGWCDSVFNYNEAFQKSSWNKDYSEDLWRASSFNTRNLCSVISEQQLAETHQND